MSSQETALQDALRELAEAKSRITCLEETFSQSASHDLLAPLRNVEFFCGILIEDCGSRLDAEGHKAITRIRANAARLEHMIRNLLVLTSVTGSGMSMDTVDLTRLCQDVFSDLRRTEHERQVVERIAGNLTVRGNQRLLRILIDHLVGNAWKFSAPRARAEIDIGITDNDAGPHVFFVRDNGIGFAMNSAEQLFTPFHRMHGVTEYPGSGLGLAIAARVVHSHGGRIWAEGTVDEGATFYFTLASERKST